MRLRIPLALGLALSAALTAPAVAKAQTGRAPNPTEYLGYPVGADFRLAGWDSITGYFNRLADASPAVRVDTLGRSTLGRPFIALTITAPQNMARLDEIRANQAKLADPRRLATGDLDRLLADQPAVVLMAHNIHSTEIASSQGAMELAYTLVTDPELRRDLQDIVVLLIPSMNPDGEQMVVDWYRRTLGTPYEGSGMPWIYHPYVGHDDNRDWFMLTQVETRLVTDFLYRRWFPEVVYDVHQMGSNGARFFVPPFDDPVNPNIDPLLVRMISLFGLRMSTDLEAAGKAGVVTGHNFDLWWDGGNRTVPARHNMVGILSEAASARLASPIFQEADDLRGAPRQGIDYPDPWVGGWWRIRDIIDYQMTSARALVDLAVRQRRWLIGRYVELGRRAIEAGRRDPYAWVIPAEQRDPGSAARMMEILRLGAVEIQRAREPFQADGVQYPAGSWIVPLAQPYRAHAQDLLERQRYPDLRLYPGGPPDRPYDVTGWTLPLQMGVRAVEVEAPFDASVSLETDTIRPPAGSIEGAGDTYALDYTTNAANLAIHRALAGGARVVFLPEPTDRGGRRWPTGSVVLRGPSVRSILERLATQEGLSARAFDGTVIGYSVTQPRVGLYQPWTASMDEGWTRWVFESWDLPYDTLHDARIRAGNLAADYDAIVLPDLTPESIVNGRRPGTVPREYAGGLGEVGAEALRRFVEDGGTLICLDASSRFAIEHLGLPVSDVRPSNEDQRSGKTFYAPGSILRVRLDTHQPLAYGMPDEAAIYYSNSAIFQVADGAKGVAVVARYPETDPLLSGYALHPEFLAGKAALVEAQLGAGRAILFGFRPQHRGQPQETFKILFNALYRGTMSGPQARGAF